MVVCLYLASIRMIADEQDASEDRRDGRDLCRLS